MRIFGAITFYESLSARKSGKIFHGLRIRFETFVFNFFNLFPYYAHVVVNNEPAGEAENEEV